VADQRTPHLVAGVGVRVEVDDPDLPRMLRARDRSGARVRDRVVTAEHDRDRPGLRDAVDLLVDHPQPARETRRHHRRIAGIDGRDLVEHARLELDRPQIAGVVARRSDRPRAEASADAVRGAVVDRRADDRDVGSHRCQVVVVGNPRQLLERRRADVRRKLEVGELLVFVLAEQQLALVDPELRRVAPLFGHDA
jgi:hypothetical protein